MPMDINCIYTMYIVHDLIQNFCILHTLERSDLSVHSFVLLANNKKTEFLIYDQILDTVTVPVGRTV